MSCIYLNLLGGMFILNLNLSGGAVLDIDSDGKLDLVLSHGEDVAQPVEVYKCTEGIRK